jgi:hypothetical protein
MELPNSEHQTVTEEDREEADSNNTHFRRGDGE